MKQLLTLIFLLIGYVPLWSQCEIIPTFFEIFCDGYDTPTDPNTQVYTLRLAVEGVNTTSTTWIYPEGEGFYGEIYEFGPYYWQEDDLLTIYDANDLNCQFSTPLVFAGCSNVNCSIDLSLEHIFNDDNGTPLDPSDDVFFGIVNISGSNTSFDGWQTNDVGFPGGEGFYGGIYAFGPYPCIEGNHVLTIYDSENTNCATSTVIPSLGCEESCGLTIEPITIVLDNNDTQILCSDDTFSAIITVNPSGQFTTGWRFNLGNGQFEEGGDYGIPDTLGPYPVYENNGTLNNFIVDITDNQNVSCNQEVMISAPESSDCSCEVDFEFTSCYNENGTPDEFADDFIDITVFSPSFIGHESTAYQVFIDEISVYLGNATSVILQQPADGLNHIITVSDAIIDCSKSKDIPTQGAISVEVQTSIDDNDTVADCSDDFFTILVTLENSNIESTSWLAADSYGNIFSGLYNVPIILGPFNIYPISVLTISFSDALSPECVKVLEIAPDISTPNLSISQSGDFCDTENGISLLATSDIENATYSWSTGESGAEISVLTPGVYSVTATPTGVFHSNIYFSGEPTVIEVINSQEEDVPFNSNSGILTFIEASEVSSTEFTMSFPDACGNLGDQICLPMVVNNFEDIISMQFSMQYDPSSLVFVGAQNFSESLPGFNNSIFEVSPGVLTLAWSEIFGVDIQDGTSIVELCFGVINSNSSEINFSDSPTPSEIINSNSQDIPFNGQSGNIIINDNSIENLNGFTVSLPDQCANQDGETCVPLLVYNFIDILGFQFSMNYDPSLLVFTHAQNFEENLLGFNLIGDVSPGNLTFSWNSPLAQGHTLPNGAAIVELCFASLQNNCLANITEIEVQPDDCSNLLEGFVFNSVNCSSDGIINTLSNWMIEIQGNNYLNYLTSNADGYYSAYLPTGQYTITLIPPSPAWMSCLEQENIEFENTGETRSLNLFATAIEDCPLLEVSININANLRPCWDDRPIHIQYQNVGTDTLYDGLIAVVLPLDLTYTHVSNGSYLGQTADTVFFTTQSPLVPGASYQFTVYVSVDCDTPQSSTLCVRTLGLPYGPCPQADDAWSGASLRASANCTTEEVIFYMRNIGESPMSEQGSYIVIQDGVMLMEAPDHFPPLGSDEESTISFPANGATYRLELQQEANHPGYSQPIAVIEGCGTNDEGSFSMGFIQRLPHDDADIFIDEDCRQVTNSYDPNDKQAEPQGFDEMHYIETDQALEYIIRFQNTGTDTAFTVVVRDTLSDWLDMRSLQTGVSSHPYELQLDSARAISFIFNNILLPDSTTNLEGSQGFVTFRIQPIADVPLKTRVENTAAIYFDLNEPIITNTTFHTFGRNFIDIINWVSSANHQWHWNVFPNPANDHINIIQVGRNQAIVFVLHDALGRQQKRILLSSGETSIDVRELTQGWYTFQLLSLEGQLLGAGKVVKK